MICAGPAALHLFPYCKGLAPQMQDPRRARRRPDSAKTLDNIYCKTYNKYRNKWLGKGAMGLQNTAMVRQENCRAIWRAVRLLGAATKKEVAGRTGLSFSTCSALINEMVRGGALTALVEQRAACGRPSLAYCINAGYRLLLCMRLEQQGTEFVLRRTLRDLCGAEVAHSESRCADAGALAALRAACAQDCAGGRVGIIGVGLPGVVRRGGQVLSCDCRSLAGVDLPRELGALTGLPVLCENDINLCAYGLDRQNGYAEADSIAVVSCYRGILPGAGLVVDGRIVRGTTDFAGEISALPLPESAPLTRLAMQIACIAAVVDPALVAVVGDGCDDAALPQLRRLLNGLLPPDHRPELTRLDDLSSAADGLVRLCLQQLENEAL